MLSSHRVYLSTWGRQLGPPFTPFHFVVLKAPSVTKMLRPNNAHNSLNLLKDQKFLMQSKFSFPLFFLFVGFLFCFFTTGHFLRGLRGYSVLAPTALSGSELSLSSLQGQGHQESTHRAPPDT